MRMPSVVAIGLEDDSHEERARRRVLVLLRLAHVEASLEDPRRDRGDDPWPVPTREREDGLIGGLGWIHHPRIDDPEACVKAALAAHHAPTI